MLCHVFRAHKPCQWSLSSGHETDAMDQRMHLFDPHPNWIHRPDVLHTRQP